MNKNNFSYKLLLGNACQLLPVGYYDRVYCGAAIPAEEAGFMKSLIAVLFLFTSYFFDIL